MKCLKTSIAKCDKDYQALQNRMNATKKVNSDMKTETKVLVSEANQIKKEKELLETNMRNNCKYISENEGKHKKLVDTVQMTFRGLKSELNQIKDDMSDFERISKRFADEKANGIAGVKSALKVISQKMKTCENDIEDSQQSIASVTKQYNETKKLVKDT